VSGKRQWPKGANDGPKQRTYTCSCGAVSSSPIRHNHRPYPTKPQQDPKQR